VVPGSTYGRMSSFDVNRTGSSTLVEVALCAKRWERQSNASN
jgi:hypothetical protein